MSFGDFVQKLIPTDLFGGMSVTGGYLFRKKETIQYPEKKFEPKDRFRGMFGYDLERCIASGLIVSEAQLVRERLRAGEDRESSDLPFLCLHHGDFGPGNIFIDGDEARVPADEVVRDRRVDDGLADEVAVGAAAFLVVERRDLRPCPECADARILRIAVQR